MLKNPILWITVLLQTAGPYLFGFGNWANIIQYISGFGMAYAIYEYFVHHRREFNQMKRQVAHLYEKHDKHANEVKKDV